MATQTVGKVKTSKNGSWVDKTIDAGKSFYQTNKDVYTSAIGAAKRIYDNYAGAKQSNSTYQANPNGAFNTATDWRFTAPASTKKINYTGDGKDLNIGMDEKLYRANNRKTDAAATKNSGFYGLGTIGGFSASAAYQQAMAYTNSLLEQLNSGRTAYSDKIDSLMAKIEGREKFSYDFNNDPLFQNALASAMQSGQTAMQDTIGQASALTGGYGSSYATSAANQAYNSFVQDAYNQLPEFYNMALNAYQMEGNELYNQLGMYQTADSTAYDRLYNAYSANLANAQNMYNQEYNNYWDTANYNQAAAKFNASRQNELYDNAQTAAAKAATEAAKNSASSAYKKASSTEYSKALKAYEEGGDNGLDQYLATLSEDLDIEDIMSYVDKYAYGGVKNMGWKNTKDTRNWGGSNTLDNNDRVTSTDGQSYSLKQFVNYLVTMGMSEEQALAYAKTFNGNR